MIGARPRRCVFLSVGSMKHHKLIPESERILVVSTSEVCMCVSVFFMSAR